ncbi:actin-like ATPase domain-containing protein, partial [Aureobasidium melanogenum]
MAPPGRRKISSITFLPLLFLLLLATSAQAASAVLGIDFGTEYIKAAIAKPGAPIEIVLSKDSKRKEAATIAFKPSRLQTNPAQTYPERLYGGDAVALSARFPVDVYPNLKTLLGVDISSDAVETYRTRHPGLNVVPVPRSDADKDAGNTVGFKSQSFGKKEEVFMVEELLAMELKNIRNNAEAMVPKGTYVTDVVITYPAFSTAEEKRALELAADLAGLRVLGLVSDGLAVGLNYATLHAFDSVSEGGKPEYHLVYDMGAGSTTATLLKCQGRTVKGYGKRNQTVQEVIVVGTGYDATLGGDSLNDVIVEDIVNQFLEAPQVKKLGLDKSQLRSHGKAMARIRKEAERIRQLLSANAVSGATLEGIYNEDITFKYSLTRDKFEELAADHAARVGKPLSAALQSAGLELSDLDSIILHGGVIRTPFVQKQLEKVAGGAAKLKANVNADEAAVMGATFKAASLSTSFRVKDIRGTDISGFPFSLKWTAEKKDRTQKVFTPASQVGTEKQVPIKTLQDLKLDFLQTVHDRDIPIAEVAATNITKSVTELKEKYGCGAANISTVFNVQLRPLDALPEIVSGSVSCETNGSKSGGVMDNVKGLFGFGGKKGDEQQVLQKEDTTEEGIASETPLPVSDPTSSGSTISSASPSPEPSASSASDSAKPAQATPSVVSIPLAVKSKPLGRNIPPVKSLPQIRQRLTQFDNSDRNAALRAEALNTLEAFTYRTRDYLEDESFIAASGEKARKELEKQLAGISEWLDEKGADATLEDFQGKLKDLRKLVDPVLKRREEASRRPDAIKALQDGLESLNSMIKMVEGSIQKAAESAASSASSVASSVASSATSSPSSSSSVADVDDDLEEDPYSSTASAAADEEADAEPTAAETETVKPYEYTLDDLSLLKAKHETVRAWLDEKLALQDKLQPHEEPAFLVADLEKRGQELQKVVSEMIMKTIKMQESPRKAKGGKKAAKSKSNKSKTKSSSSSSTSSTAGGSESTSSSSPAKSASASASSSRRDEL